MGALFRFPVATAGFEEFVTWAERTGLTVLVSAADGAEERTIEIGEPLGSSVSIVGERLVVAGADGELQVVGEGHRGNVMRNA